MNRLLISSWLAVLVMPQVVSHAALVGPWLNTMADRDAIYTPGSVRLTFQVSPAARLAGPYDLRIIVYVAQNKVREQTMTITQGQPASYDLSFPRVHAITRGSYRAELSMGNELLEAREGPIALWPPRDPATVGPCNAKVWVLDTSGTLQTLLPELGLKPADAAFQAVRDFSPPDIIFAGEHLDGASMEILTQRIAATSKPLVVVLLRQRQWPGELDASIRRGTDPCQPVTSEPNSLLLEDLSGGDVIRLLKEANAVAVERWAGRSIHSHLTAGDDTKRVSSCLCVVREANRLLLFCQLPATAREDPRQMTLLHNLVQFACRNADPNPETRIERERR